jgi:hypothetical protein
VLVANAALPSSSGKNPSACIAHMHAEMCQMTQANQGRSRTGAFIAIDSPGQVPVLPVAAGLAS